MRADQKRGAGWVVVVTGGEDKRHGPAQGDGERRAGGGRVGGPPRAYRVSGFTAPHCGSMRAADVGRDIELYGWVARRRDHAGLIFIDLRDRWGAVQVVFNPAKAAEAHPVASELRADYVVRAKGA